MKKKMKILAGITAFALIGGLLGVANAFVGNPISKMLAERTAEKYIEENYSNMELELTDATYSFKSSNYYVDVKSPTSIDTHFTISLSALGKVEGDYYENSVLQKWNTFERISNSYRTKVEAIFDQSDFPYASTICFADLVGRTAEEVSRDEESFGPIYGLIIEDLELDKDYDIAELGKTAGSVVFYAEDEDVSVKRAAEILLDIKSILDQENLPFYTIDFVLEKPRKEDEKPMRDAVTVSVNEFLYSDIYEEGLEQRITDAAKALEEYYKEQDAEKEKIESEVLVDL